MRKVIAVLGIAAVVVIGCVGICLINDNVAAKEGSEITDISEGAFTTDADEKDKKYYDYLEDKLEKHLGTLDNVGDVAVDIRMKEDASTVDSVLVTYESETLLSDKELQQWESFIRVQLGEEQIDVRFEQK